MTRAMTGIVGNPIIKNSWKKCPLPVNGSISKPQSVFSMVTFGDWSDPRCDGTPPFARDFRIILFHDIFCIINYKHAERFPP